MQPSLSDLETARTRYILKYGQFRLIRYLISSAREFYDVVRTVNKMAGKAEGKQDVIALQRLIRVNFINLPNFLSKFIACFEVPVSVLGADRVKIPTLLNFAEFEMYLPDYRYDRRGPEISVSYDIASLFDINLSLYHFESTLVGAVSGQQWVALKQSLRVDVDPSMSVTKESGLTLSVRVPMTVLTAAENALQRR